MAIRSATLIPFLIAEACLSCGKRAVAQPESHSMLLGHASFPVWSAPLAQAQQGSVRVTLHGEGDIDDDCPDRDAGQFVAEYDGALSVAPDGTFEAALAPFSPPIATPVGCRVTSLEVHRIDSVVILAELPALQMEGEGSLVFQNLGAVDLDELQAGDFGELYARIAFHPLMTATP
jgi:hypothetical protein